MPYITKIAKDRLAETNQAESAGELNYLVTRLCVSYTKREGLKYLSICIVMGTLICAAFEYYRRMAAPYEDEKIKENGDVYE